MKYGINMIVVMLAASGLLISGCSDDSSAGISKLNFMSGAIESLPRADSSGGALVYASPLMANASSGTNITSVDILNTFFDYQCHEGAGNNFCPAGVDITTGGENNVYKFTSYTLLGLIYHAELYSGGKHTSCDMGSAATIDATSYTSVSAGDPDKYILDYNSLLKCVYADPSNNDTSKQYYAYSSDTAGSYQATLTSRNRMPYQGITDPGQNDVFQVYVSLDSSGTPTFLAFNYVSASDDSIRTLLLVNLVTNKFAAKFINYNSISSNYNKVVAMGVGGVDRATGTPNSGYFLLNYVENGNPEVTDKCVNNADGFIETDMTNCTAGSIPTTAGWGATSVQTYLGMTATEISHLAPWLARMTDATALLSTDLPASIAAADTEVPRTIQAATTP